MNGQTHLRQIANDGRRSPVQSGENRTGDLQGHAGLRCAEPQRSPPAVQRSGGLARKKQRRTDAARRTGAGRRRTGAVPSRRFRAAEKLHALPSAARTAPRIERAVFEPRRDGRLPVAGRLAGRKAPIRPTAARPQPAHFDDDYPPQYCPAAPKRSPTRTKAELCTSTTWAS